MPERAVQLSVNSYQLTGENRPQLITDHTDPPIIPTIPTYRHTDSTDSPTYRLTDSTLAYNPRFDIEAFRALGILKSIYTNEKYKHELNSLLALTRTNLITSLAERLNVEIYKTAYLQKGTQLYHQEFYSKTPFLEVIKRGQKIRQQAGSTETEREEAEAEGFNKVQSLFAIPTTSPDAKIIVISPKGTGNSIYGHNFFDLYQKNPNGEITMSRYSSKATYSEFKAAAEMLDPFCQIPKNPKDSDFLKNPIVTCQSQEQVKATLNRDEKTLPLEDFLQVTQIVTPIIENYLDNLQKNPNLAKQSALYHALTKSADIAAGLDNQFEGPARERVMSSIRYKDVERIAAFLSSQPQRQVKTACGISGSVNVNPYSVWEFANSNINLRTQDKSDFPCPRCGKIITYGAGIKKCPGCGLEATCA